MIETANSPPPSSDVLEKFEDVLGKSGVEFDTECINTEVANTLGYRVPAHGILYPENTDQVRAVVKIANEHHIPLYPLSKGENIGYGERCPVRPGQVIINLGRMNAIRNYDTLAGAVTVEPGVTQKQLYEFLLSRRSPFRMDATGAGLDSSILGNSLEGGFGHTPKGNRRTTITDIEVVLGNGNLLRTGTFPGLGPDLSGLFIQSNFGIVTAATVALMAMPESFVSFALTVADDGRLENLIGRIHELRLQGVLTSLVHIANALRSFMTINRCPPEYKERIMTEEDAVALMSSAILRVGSWSAVGALYGTKNGIRSGIKELRKAFKGIGRVTFFTDDKISRIERLASLPVLKTVPAVEKIGRSVSSYRDIHGFMQGIPSDGPFRNITWRLDSHADMGLIWYAPVIPADPAAVRSVLSVAGKLFSTFGFEMPVTLTFVTPSVLVGVISIHFNRNDDKQRNSAHKLYFALKREMAGFGIEPYRHGIMGMDDIRYMQEGKSGALHELKRTFDPNNIISPGRYNI